MLGYIDWAWFPRYLRSPPPGGLHSIKEVPVIIQIHKINLDWQQSRNIVIDADINLKIFSITYHLYATAFRIRFNSAVGGDYVDT